MKGLLALIVSALLSSALLFPLPTGALAGKSCKMPEGNTLADGGCKCLAKRSGIECFCCFAGDLKEVEPAVTPEGRTIPVPKRDSEGKPILK